MKTIITILFLLAAFIAPVGNTHAGAQDEKLKQLTAQLQGNPNNTALREEIIKLALTMKPEPAVPEEAERHMVRGAAAFKGAKSPNDFKDAVREFEQASLAAPWSGDIYYNLGLAQDKAGDYASAVRSLKLAVLATPNSKEAKNLFYEVEYRLEKTNSPEAQAAKKREQEEAILRNLDGAIYRYEMRDGRGTLLYRSAITIHGNRATLTEWSSTGSDPRTTTNSCVLDGLRCEWPNPPPYIKGTHIIEISSDGRQVTKMFRFANGQMEDSEPSHAVHVRQ